MGERSRGYLRGGERLASYERAHSTWIRRRGPGLAARTAWGFGVVAMGNSVKTAATGRSATLADVGVVGNGQITALVRADGSVPWCCWPRPDGDPIFCDLLSPPSQPRSTGVFRISIV